MQRSIVVAVALVAAATLFGTTTPAEARTTTYEDLLGRFECKVDDDFEQVPPKPGTDDLHVAGEFKDGSPVYGRYSGDQPTFRIIWTVTPKGEKPPEEIELPPEAEGWSPQQKAIWQALRSAGTKESLESDVNKMLQWNARLFGEYVPVADYWAKQKKAKVLKTRDGTEVEVLEINYHKKRPKGTDATWWMWVARTSWETEAEKIELGFYGYVDVKFAKDFRKRYEATVKSFKLTEVEEDDEDVPEFVGDADNPYEAKIAEFIKTKVIKGWKTKRTPHYLIVYDEDVNQKKIVNRVAKEIEALREQVYEVIFPADRPVQAISIVRICETRQQYMAYGAPGGSAGYWSPYHEELVLYQDKNDKKDAIRVLYHEAFHQYIFYSVGEISPHSWFNEGHGDFFSGHVYKSGKFKREPFGWRTEPAREWKRRWQEGIKRKVAPESGPVTGDGESSNQPAVGDRLTLREWLTWRQRRYYGSNEFGIPGGANYALGWSFIYFLRTTKNEEYQKILPTYFNTLKSFVTEARDAAEKALEDGGLTGGGGAPDGGEPGGDGEPGKDGEPGGDGEPGDGGTAGGENPEDPENPEGLDGPGSLTSDVVTRDKWHGATLEEATRGLDLEQLEKDWLEHSW